METEILVARGDRVRVSEAYKERASLFNYAYSPADLTLRLESVRQNDTGFYRCEVQQGLEDANDVVQVKVKGETYIYIFLSDCQSTTKYIVCSINEHTKNFPFKIKLHLNCL